MKTVQIITSRPLGLRCHELAEKMLPEGWKLDFDTTRPHSFGVDVVISVLYAKVIDDFSSLARYYNFHPGILPEYAGSATLSWSILNGEREAGCTLHELVREVDGGGIIDVRKFPIMEWDTAEDLARKFTETAEWMFVDWFVKILNDNPKLLAVPQDKTKRRNYKRKELDGQKDLTRVVRALTFPGKEQAFFDTKDGRRFELSYYDGVKEIINEAKPQ